MSYRRILTIVSIALVFVTIYIIRDTYGLFESKNVMTMENNLAKWQVLINGTNVTSNKKFVVDTINVTNSDNVKEGKIAPGCEGYFDIVINPTDTDVSIVYNITFDFSKISNSFTFYKIEEIASGNLIRTGENTYSKVISLEEIKKGVTNTIRVYVKWENIEDNNDYDSEIGIAKDSSINIPVAVEVSQYFNEKIEEYQNE